MLHHNTLRRPASTRRTTQQIANYLVTLIVCTSLLLPANAFAQTSPATLRAGDACTSALLGADALEGESILQPASPSAPVAIPKADVDRAIFIANWRMHSSDAAALESLIHGLFLMAGAGDLLAQLTAKFHQTIPLDEMNDRVKHPLDQIVFAYFDAALGIPALVPLVPAAWDALHAGIPRDEIVVDSSFLIAQSTQRHSLGERMLQNALEYMADLHECARLNAAVGNLFDAQHGQALKASIRDSASAILQKNADLELPAKLVQSIQPDGTALLSLDQLNDIGDDGLAELNATMDEMLAAAKEIDQKQTDIVEYLNNPQKKQDAEKLAKEKAEKAAEQFKKAQSAINAASTLMGKLDPVLAKQFKTMTSSYLEIVKSVNTWLEAVAGKGTLDKIFSFSTATMAGNVIGAIMNIVSLFGESKPSPEQQILEQIGKLRQQVNQLRQEMHARFDRIDAQLNVIFTTMQQRFDQIDVQLGVINGNVRDVQRSLIELDLHLSQFERNNFELLNVLGRRPLLDAINSGLDYQRITGTAMPFQPEFVGFERTFHTWGTVHAFDPLNTGPSQRDYGDAALYHELTTYPLDTNLNYLNGWLAAHGLTPIATGMLASPRDWLLASRAYTQLGAEWPQHMARIDAAELTKLTAVGQQIEQAIQKITAPPTAVTAAAADDSYFDVVAALYNGKMAQLNTGLEQIESTYVQELRASQLDPAVPFDLFGGTDQELHKAQGSSELWLPPGYTKVELEDPINFVPIILPVPASVQNLVLLERRQRLAELLKLSGSQTRITMVATEDNRVNFPCQPPLKPKDCVSSAHVVVTMELHLGSIVWKTLSWDMGTVVMGRLETAVDYVARIWASKMAEFDQNAVTVPPTPDEQNLINSRFANLKGSLDARLMEYEQILYARMVDAMSSGNLHALMVEIAGAKALLDAFTSLGLPRAVANDEFLRALLFGEQRIFDDVLIINTFALSATQPITGASLLINQRPLMMERSAARVTLYIQIIDSYLAAIAGASSMAAADLGAETAGSYTEGADYLESARHALDLTVRIARIPRTQTPGGSLRLYLPLVDR